jgi:transcriptional regulator with XRE-family HTH domain
MDVKREIQEFLTSRRARVTPAAAGLTTSGRQRRVPGLRREEVALLAGVSVDYYAQMERGNLSGVSDGVLEALARGLQLDGAERMHLFDLARAARPTVASPQLRTQPEGVRPSMQHMLDAMTGSAAMVRNDRLDVLAANLLSRALYCQLYDGPAGRPANVARFCFLDPRAREFFVQWERRASDLVAILHSATGRNPRDRALSELIDELSERSCEFRTWWANHDVQLHMDCEKHYRHPVVGEIRFTFESLALTSAPGLTVLVLTPTPGTPDEESLRLLGSWAATLDAEQTGAPAAAQAPRRS